METTIITPKTKIYDLLEAYPQLESLLIELAPEFRKLKNPVLRNTIARIATISQAATIGGLNVEQLVNRLRNEVGQGSIEHLENPGSKYTTATPTWFRSEMIAGTIDVGEMLNRGEQPVHEVLSSIKELGKGKILEVAAPFIPAPLLDKAIGLGYRHWLIVGEGGRVTVYFINEE